MHTLVKGLDQFNWTMFNALVQNRDCCPVHIHSHTTVHTMKTLVYTAVVLWVRYYAQNIYYCKQIIATYIYIIIISTYLSYLISVQPWCIEVGWGFFTYPRQSGNMPQLSVGHCMWRLVGYIWCSSGLQTTGIPYLRLIIIIIIHVCHCFKPKDRWEENVYIIVCVTQHE